MTTRASSRHERGQILILTVLSMTVLLGMAALSIDASFMYDKRNQLYAAADAAAKIGAAEVHRNPAVLAAALQVFADSQAVMLGLTPGGCGSTTPGTTSVCVNHPPMNGPFAGNLGYVEAIVTQVTSTFFGRVIGLTSLTPGARAVAGVSHSSGCLTTLGSSPAGLVVTSPATGVGISAPGCDILVGGDLDDGNKLTAESIGYADTCFSGCPPAVRAPAPSDPLAGLPTPTAADCNSGLPGTDVLVNAVLPPLTPGTYHNITFSGPNGWLTFAGGVYCVTGAITAANPGSQVKMTDNAGVTIYIGPSGSVFLDSNAVDVNLQAQAAGTYEGIVFFQDRSNNSTFQMAKNTGPWVIDGVIYVPSAVVDAKNANFAASNQCGLIVSYGLRMDKPDMSFDNRCGGFGGSPLSTVSMAE
jgi:Flp pilus assembly protein TadG